MPLKSWDEVAPEPLRFPINGKTYELPPTDAGTGIALLKLSAGDDSYDATRLEGRSMWQLMLGPLYDQMLTDGVPVEAVRRAAGAALALWRTSDRKLAETVWETGVDPEAVAAMAANQQTQPSTRPAAATSTRTPASGTGTRTKTAARKATARKSASSRSSRKRS